MFALEVLCLIATVCAACAIGGMCVVGAVVWMAGHRRAHTHR